MRKRKQAHDPRQRRLFLTTSNRIDYSIRRCPNDDTHKIIGTPFSHGGRTWYCPDCGMEWKASLRTGFMDYFRLTDEGEAELVKRVALHFYPEVSI